MRLPNFYEQNLIPNWGITFAKQYPQRQGRRKEICYVKEKTGGMAWGEAVYGYER